MRTFIQLFIVLILILVGIAIFSILGKNKEKNTFMNQCMTGKTYEQCEQDFLMKRAGKTMPSNMQILENNDIFKNAQSTPQTINGLDSL